MVIVRLSADDIALMNTLLPPLPAFGLVWLPEGAGLPTVLQVTLSLAPLWIVNPNRLAAGLNANVIPSPGSSAGLKPPLASGFASSVVVGVSNELLYDANATPLSIR